MKYNTPESSLMEKVLWILALALVAAALILGFQATGGPGYQRLVRHDATRTTRIREVSTALINYYQEHDNQLPKSLAVLLTDNAQRINPHLKPRDTVDPVSKAQFPYKRLSANQFELCVTYDTEKKLLQDAPESNRMPPVYLSRYQYSLEGDTFEEHLRGPKCYTLKVVAKPL
jgi:hypothetical protein